MSVSISDLTKEFDGPDGEKIIAVEEFNMDINEGEFIVLVGPSGCGKTTTLRCLAGLETPTFGDIRLNGETVTDWNPQDRDIAMVFQKYALYPHLSVRENMGFGLKNRTDMPKAKIDERVEEVAELMDITELLEKDPSDLSGGQQQRVATGRAIVRDPEVFLFDEPLSNLDAKLRKHMRTEIQQLQERLDTTSVYVTHDQEEAMTMADRLAVLNDGELQQVGPPTEIYNHPVNRFVADFIGEPSMNFFNVTLDGGRLLNDNFAVNLSAELADHVGDHKDLVLGIRPENITIADESNIKMTMEVLEELGSANLLYLSFDDDDEMYIVETDPSVTPNQDDVVSVTFAEEDFYLFDAETGETLVSRGAPIDRNQP